MSTQTIKVYIDGSKTLEVRGTKRGRFFVHHPIWENWRGAPWAVTHIETGLKFPTTFRRKAQAIKFAEEIEAMTDWDKLRVAYPRKGSRKTRLLSKCPTQRQQKAMFRLAEQLSAQ